MASGAVRELITKIKFQLDKASETKVKSTMQEIKRQLNNFAKNPTKTKISVDTTRATTALQSIKTQLNSLQGKTVTTYVQTKQRGSHGAGRGGNGGDFRNELASGLGLPMGLPPGAVAAAGFVAVGGAAAAATKTFAEFDATMSRVKALTGATNEEMELLTKTARELGASTKYSATEAAQAMTYLGMAGWKTTEIVAAMPGMLALAAASGEDLSRVADIVSDDLTAFRLPAEQAGHFADVLAVASTKANTTVGMMGETFKYVGPLAGSLGFSIEDMALATGIMANSSIKGEQAGTTLRALLTRLAKPTKESAEAMDRLGLTITDASGKMRPFRQILEDMRTGFANLSEAEKAEVAAALAGQEAMSGTLALANESEAKFNELTSAIDNSHGASKRLSDTMNDNLLGDLQTLKSQVEETALVFGGVLEPSVRDAVNNIRTSLKDFTENTLVPFFTLMAGPQGDSMASLNQYNELAAQHPTMMKFIEFLREMNEVAGKASEAIGNIASKINEAFGNETVNAVIQKLLDLMSMWAKFAGESVGDFGLAGFSPLGMGLEIGKQVSGAMVDFISAAVDKIGELVVLGVQKLGELAQAVAETASKMVQGFGEAVGKINGLIGDMASKAIEAINSILDGFANIEATSDRVRIKLGENAAAARALTSNVSVTNNVNVGSTQEAVDYTNNSVPRVSVFD
jgi:TP901 family phage tail tape measure protein